MKAIWQIINSPIIVAIICMGALVGLVRSCSGDFGSFHEDHNMRLRMEALPRLQVLSFNEAHVPTNTNQKFVGVLRNNSRYIVSNIRGAVCFYDKDHLLVDVICNGLDCPNAVAPGATNVFSIERPTSREYGYAIYHCPETNVEFRFVSVNALEME